jgi:hypothetical protein
MTIPSATSNSIHTPAATIHQPFSLTLHGEEKAIAPSYGEEISVVNNALPGRGVTIIQKNKNHVTAHNGCIIHQTSIIHDLAKAIIATGCAAFALATSYLGIRTVQPEVLKQGLQTFSRMLNTFT